MKTIAELLELLERLRAAKIHHRLDQWRDDAIAIEITVPGERWDVEVHGDGVIEVERFKSDGEIADAATLDDLFRDFSD